MATRIYHVGNQAELQQSGPNDLLELFPAPGANPLFLKRNFLDVLVYGLACHEFIHLSGPTGSAKSSVLEALAMAENYLPLCAINNLPVKLAVRILPVEMATFESPAELYQRRALRDGSTFDEPSSLVLALRQAEELKGEAQPVIWLREMGRVHSPSVQGGLLNLMCKSDIILPGGDHIDGRGISWVADSNYQADGDATHTLVTLDDALKRRFSINLTQDYLDGEQEEEVLHHLMGGEEARAEIIEMIPGVIRLGQEIRSQRLEGNLQSITPPTIYGYLSLLRLQQAMPCLSLQDAVNATMLGNASLEDSKQASTIFNRIFGLQSEMDMDDAMGGDWI